MFRSGRLTLGILALIGAWYLLTLRSGHEWGDDFSLYLGHARNLVQGVDYADTGYIYNPYFPSLSPRTYPPVFPLLLAPVVRCFGLNLLAMKVELVLLFVLFLVVLYAAFRKELPRPYLLAVLILLGFHPYFWDYKDRVLSEIPFLLFCYLALYLLGRAQEAVGRRRGVAIFLAGATIYLACGTRSVGVVLLPCVLLEELVRKRRLGVVSAGVFVTFACGVLIQRSLLPLDGSYLDQLVFDPPLFARNLVSLIKALGLYLENGYSDALRVLLFAGVSGLALLGFVHRVGEQITSREIFVVLYVAAVTVWPSAEWNQRFLMPLVPLYLIYAVHGVHRLGVLVGPYLERPLGFGMATLLLASYGGQYTLFDFGPLREGIAKPESEALFEYVRTKTPADAVFLFQKPRALALYTGRRASAHHTPATDADLFSYLRQISATHVVIGTVFPQSHAYLRSFALRHPDELSVVYRNADFTVYKVRDGPERRASVR
jgi:hypothetical protein